MVDQKIPQSVRDQVALVRFVEDIIKEKNDPSIKPDQLPHIKEALLRQLNEMINTHLITLLSEADQRELDEQLNKKISDEGLDQFFIKKIPNLATEIAAVLLNFRSAYLAKLPIKENVPIPAPVAPSKTN